MHLIFGGERESAEKRPKFKLKSFFHELKMLSASLVSTFKSDTGNVSIGGRAWGQDRMSQQNEKSTKWTSIVFALTG